MPRLLRIEFPGALYHIMARGNRGDSIFADDEDRWRWLQTLGEASQKTGWRVHAGVLMGNHYRGRQKQGSMNHENSKIQGPLRPLFQE